MLIFDRDESFDECGDNVGLESRQVVNENKKRFLAVLELVLQIAASSLAVFRG